MRQTMGDDFICNNANNARLSSENATIMPFFYNFIKMPKCHFNAKGLNNAKIAKNGIIKCQLATLLLTVQAYFTLSVFACREVANIGCMHFQTLHSQLFISYNRTHAK